MFGVDLFFPKRKALLSIYSFLKIEHFFELTLEIEL
jgi:hypothetical protein